MGNKFYRGCTFLAVVKVRCQCGCRSIGAWVVIQTLDEASFGNFHGEAMEKPSGHQQSPIKSQTLTYDTIVVVSLQLAMRRVLPWPIAIASPRAFARIDGFHSQKLGDLDRRCTEGPIPFQFKKC